jgi:hypothetical protein
MENTTTACGGLAELPRQWDVVRAILRQDKLVGTGKVVVVLPVVVVELVWWLLVVVGGVVVVAGGGWVGGHL